MPQEAIALFLRLIPAPVGILGLFILLPYYMAQEVIALCLRLIPAPVDFRAFYFVSLLHGTGSHRSFPSPHSCACGGTLLPTQQNANPIIKTYHFNSPVPYNRCLFVVRIPLPVLHYGAFFLACFVQP
jgi:hypothetical protein